ncbi:MAG: epoxide hydrolase 1 [Acidimicrobiia bacterium]|nr:epoxide hydrolase 1 [Acidimicrobiia bacterium]
MRSRQRWIVFVVALVTGEGVWSCGGPAGAPPAASSQPPPASGSGPAPQGDQIVPFTIHVPDEVLADLKDRLARTRLPDAIDGSGWTYGTDLAYLKELIAYWRDTFDWRAQERRLNAFEQFKTNIDGIEVHFVHRKSAQPNALPLLITHGWPGSFVEFTKIIGPLSDPTSHGGRAEDAFHVVAPSIPGYGFSAAPRSSGYGPQRMADIFAKLMTRLGYERYGTQGGDWGSIISRSLAVQDASHVAGLHLNFCVGGPPPGGQNAIDTLPPAEAEKVRSRLFAAGEEQGYSGIQGTKPQTVGYGLNDSPAGLAAWIVEKFRSWCDCDGDVEKKFTKDELLTNITVYWVTQTATSSARLYYESRHAGAVKLPRIDVPTGCAIFPRELVYAPRVWLEPGMNLVHWTEMPRGGHFAALEEPGLLVDDVRTFFRGLRSPTRGN